MPKKNLSSTYYEGRKHATNKPGSKSLEQTPIRHNTSQQGLIGKTTPDDKTLSQPKTRSEAMKCKAPKIS